MAKTKQRKQIKSGAIRAYMAAHPSAGPTEVSKALAAKGIKVSPAHVSNVKKTSSNGHPTDDRVSLSQLVEARRFAKQMGGVAAAADLLQALKKLLA